MAKKSTSRKKTARKSALTETAISVPSATTSEPAEVLDRIQRRADELYLARGQQPGHDFKDWLNAERELLGKRAVEPARVTLPSAELMDALLADILEGLTFNTHHTKGEKTWHL
jgi:hypothetical protein